MLERWLPRARDKAVEIKLDDNNVEPGEYSVTSQRLHMRHMLFSEIESFLGKNNLDLSGTNFEFARDCVTGNDPVLAKAVQQHLADGLPLTNIIVTEMLARLRPAQLTAERLLAVLEAMDGQMAALAGLTDKAHGSVSDFGAALKEQMRDLDAGQAPNIAHRLVSLTLAMVERSQAIEKEVRESYKQTKKLRRDLDKARHAADHDTLTNLPNRRAFEKRFAQEIELAEANGGRLSVAFCDIDHFKAVNDDFGHDTGDRVIKLVGTTLAQVSGNQCYVARHGGEEFVILFPGKSVDEAAQIVNDARLEVASKQLVHRETGKRLGVVSFSAGMAEVSECKSLTETLGAADKALYFAKNNGRNCIGIASMTGPQLFSDAARG